MRVLLALLAPLLLAGCAMPWGSSSESTTARKVDLRLGGYTELDFSMQQGAVVEIAIRANGTIRWDIHTHDASGVRTLRQGNGTEVSERFEAPAAGAYSLMIQNAALAETQVDFSVRGDYTLR